MPTAKKKSIMWAGVDYGSKLAGTTCLAWAQDHRIHIIQSQKNDDADAWLTEQVEVKGFKKIFIDAPLSLPPAYYNEEADDFFYRSADRELKAMSPMFLGGLTARAMRLKKMWTQKGIAVLETYPAALAREWTLPEYKKNLNPCMKELNGKLKSNDFELAAQPQNWHQVDALLAWCSGLRWMNNEMREVGDDFGKIII